MKSDTLKYMTAYASTDPPASVRRFFYVECFYRTKLMIVLLLYLFIGSIDPTQSPKLLTLQLNILHDSGSNGGSQLDLLDLVQKRNNPACC
jgi:hypothetical protein